MESKSPKVFAGLAALPDEPTGGSLCFEAGKRIEQGVCTALE
jgi:hypothetical protein